MSLTTLDLLTKKINFYDELAVKFVHNVLKYQLVYKCYNIEIY